jgi:hypothetical protein
VRTGRASGDITRKVPWFGIALLLTLRDWIARAGF